MITQERVMDLFIYEVDGRLVRKRYPGGRYVNGSDIGSVKKNGYRLAQVDKEYYLVHRLIWLFHYGYFPENHIDHINRNQLDNRIENLREVSSSCNARNTGNSRSNTSGVKGVSWDKKNQRWSASIRVNYKNIFLGRHLDFCEAACFRLAAEQSLGWAGCDSFSPAFKYVKENILDR